MAMGKAPLNTFNPSCHTSKMTEEKIITVRDGWVRHVASCLTGKDLATVAGYKFAGKDEALVLDEVVFSLHVEYVCEAHN